MTQAKPALYAFNRGLISTLGLARIDIKKQALAAQKQTNFMPRILGSMMLRPGTQYVGNTNGNAVAVCVPFIFSCTDVAFLEFTDSVLRPWLVTNTSGGPPYTESVITRASVATTLTNGTFAGNINGWTNSDQGGATSAWMTGNYMSFIGTGFNTAGEYQALTISSADQSTEHALRIVVAQGTVTVFVGTSVGDDSVMNRRTISAGTHSLAFTPNAGTVYLQFTSNVNFPSLLQSVAIESAGVLTLPSPYPIGALQVTANLNQTTLLRYDQSGDVVYLACDGYAQYKVIRTYGETNPRSWSIVLYRPVDGPFMLQNVTGVEMTSSVLTGAGTLTSSQPHFYPGHVGALFQLASNGQYVSAAVSGTQQWTNAIQVNGEGAAQRTFGITITGTWVGTIQLQYSVGAIGSWIDVPGESWTANQANVSYYDTLDNQTIFYRIGFENTYTSGTATASLTFAQGSITGTCLVTKFVSSTVVDIVVLTEPGNTGVLGGFGSTSSTVIWWEGQWSAYQGYPTSVGLYEGRLWWAGRSAIVGSVSDAYESFDQTVVGDSGVINVTIGAGPVDRINWVLPLQDLLLGGGTAEEAVRSSDLTGPVTPTDLMIKTASTRGSASIDGIKIDYNGMFVDKSYRRLYQLVYQPNFFLLDYTSKDMTNFTPDIAYMEDGALIPFPGFAQIVVQRTPDTRIHARLNDGTVRVLVSDTEEDEQCWVKVQSAPSVAGAAQVIGSFVLPGVGEDLVYYIVQRTINGSSTCFIERWAREDECIGGAITKCIDAHTVVVNAIPSNAVTGAQYLAGETVAVWADGSDAGTYTVSGSGTFTLNGLYTNVVYGLPYTAQFQSTKLGINTQSETLLGEHKNIKQLGVIMQNAHYQGLQYGPDFTTAHLRNLPLTYKNAQQPANTVYTFYDDHSFSFPGIWDTDSRLCLQAASPRPVTIIAAVIELSQSG
jgi:hypothetical protein